MIFKLFKDGVVVAVDVFMYAFMYIYVNGMYISVITVTIVNVMQCRQPHFII